MPRAQCLSGSTITEFTLKPCRLEVVCLTVEAWMLLQSERPAECPCCTGKCPRCSGRWSDKCKRSRSARSGHRTARPGARPPGEPCETPFTETHNKLCRSSAKFKSANYKYSRKSNIGYYQSLSVATCALREFQELMLPSGAVVNVCLPPYMMKP